MSSPNHDTKSRNINELRIYPHPGFNFPSVDSVYSQEEIMELQSNLKMNAQKYLQIVLQEYGSFIGVDLSTIISPDILKIEMNGDLLLDTYIQEINDNSSLSKFEKLKKIDSLSMPAAHGARTFDDKTIHIYPSFFLVGKEKLSIDKLQAKCDEVILHEILHYFIRPQYNDDKNVSSFITEGLVDMCTRDIQTKYGINADYTSNYTDNVIFLREALHNIENVNEKNKLVFNGSVEQVLSMTSTPSFDSKKEAEKIVAYQKEKDNKKKEELTPEFRKQIRKVAAIFPNHHNSIERKMMDISANCSSKQEAITVVRQIADLKLKVSKDTKQEAVGFDQRSQNEVAIANQIKEKNMAIKQQKEQQRGLDKPKVKTLTNPSSSVRSSSSSGYVNILTLALIAIFVAVALSLIIYYIL